MIEVTDRYSSVLMATSPTGDDVVRSIIESFSRLSGVKISNQRVISTPEHFPEDLVEIVTTEHVDFVFYPWPISLDHEVHDNSAEILNGLLAVCPASVGILVNSGISHTISITEAKILVPFFGGPDDREAVEIALSFGILTCIVCYNKQSPDEKDNALIQTVANLSEQDPTVILSYREYHETDDDPEVMVKQEFENNQFSLIIMGRSSGYGEMEDTSNFERTLGKLAGRLMLHDLSLDLLIIRKGENSTKFSNFGKND